MTREWILTGPPVKRRPRVSEAEMEIFDDMRRQHCICICICICIVQSICRLPRLVRCIVSNLVHQVFQLPPVETRIEDRINFKLFHTVHLDGWRRGHDPTWKFIRHMWLQEADMKNRVNLNSTWQVQTKREVPIFSRIGYGPRRRTSSLPEGRVVWMWRRSSHTF